MRAGVLVLAVAAASGCGGGGFRMETVPGPPKASDTGAMVADPTYRLQLEDGFTVSVFDHEEASGAHTIGRDGTVGFPLIGVMPVQGMTAAELREALARRFTAYIKRPQVSVTVTAALGLKVYMLGEVGHPGVHSLAGGSRLTQAISAAGGYTSHAATDRMVVMRQRGDQMDRIYVDIRDIVEKGRHKQDVQLQPGDMIHIPRVWYPSGWQEWMVWVNFLLSLSLAANAFVLRP